MEKNKELAENNVRVIKISKNALFEFIYEKFIDNQEDFLDINSLEVTNVFDINYERGEFIFCAYRSEDTNGKILEFPKEIYLQQLMVNMQDTTSTMYADDRYKDYTKEELIELSKISK